MDSENEHSSAVHLFLCCVLPWFGLFVCLCTCLLFILFAWFRLDWGVCFFACLFVVLIVCLFAHLFLWLGLAWLVCFFVCVCLLACYWFGLVGFGLVWLFVCLF